MLLLDYLTSNILISNTYGIFNYDVLKQRFITRYAARLIRDDVDINNIAVIAQNIIDTNKDFLSALFTNTINPFKTWGETGGDSGNSSTDVNNTSTSMSKITRTDTGTLSSAGESTTDTSAEAHSVNINSGTSAHNVYAYNQSNASSPAYSDVSNDNGSVDNGSSGMGKTNTTTTETRDLTNVEDKNDTTTTMSKNTQKHSVNYQKSGYNTNDYFRILAQYQSAYDILIDLIARDILVTVIDLWG